MNNSLAIANFFIIQANKEGFNINAQKLNKLIYLAHAWNLALTNNNLFNEDVICDIYGPLIRTPYHTFKLELSKDKEQNINLIALDSKGEPHKPLEENLPLLNKVWDTYKDYSGLVLSTLTHEKNSPWDIARKEKLTYIPNAYIKKYYQTKADINGVIL